MSYFIIKINIERTVDIVRFTLVLLIEKHVTARSCKLV